MQVHIAILVLVLAAGLAAWELSRLGIHQGYAPQQPIAFPHRIHAGEYRIPCQYCHYAARTSRHAGIPPSSVCMNCHNLLDRQTREIEKLKEAVQQQRPIRWVKIHSLPDFVYFNHSQHVLSGVACRQCHGAVEAMDRVEQVAPLTMGWCVDCHRQYAHVATTGLARAIQTFSRQPKPSAGLDCISCHY
jgi:hypothetical protein